MPNNGENRPGVGAPGKDQSLLYNDIHNEFVRGFRAYLKLQEPTSQGQSREELISLRLFNRWSDSPPGSERMKFFAHLITAWELVAYDRYEPGSQAERHAAHTIARTYQYEPVIRLNDAESSALDVMTEAVGIPHTKRQNEIPIPEKYADFARWTSSAEYQTRLTAAQARQARRDK